MPMILFVFFVALALLGGYCWGWRERGAWERQLRIARGYVRLIEDINGSSNRTTWAPAPYDREDDVR